MEVRFFGTGLACLRYPPHTRTRRSKQPPRAGPLPCLNSRKGLFATLLLARTGQRRTPLTMLPRKDYEELCYRLEGLGIHSLAEYRRSQWWKRAYDMMVKSGQKTCLCCETQYWLQLHHLHYRNLGREKVRDLCWLCFRCHGFVHEFALRNGLSVRRATQQLASRRHVKAPTKRKWFKRKSRQSWKRNVIAKRGGKFYAKRDHSLIKVVSRPMV
jgi:hypothetical protein